MENEKPSSEVLHASKESSAGDETSAQDVVRSKARQAFIVWILFFTTTVAINLIIPLIFGLNLHDWTYSNAKGFLLFSINYAGFFLILPLLLIKGWNTFRRPSFIVPVAFAAVSVVLWYPIHYIATIAIVVYVYLHRRFDLSDLGFRSKGLKGDVATIVIAGAYGIIEALASSTSLQFVILPALSATIFRMFGNPASTVENLFYFGFLTDRISKQLNRYATPFLIGVMYTLHEVSNPEYWYEGLQFTFVFIGVTLFAALYIWRKSIIVTWLCDGFEWFFSRVI
jgi:hypothetical protein